MFSEVIEEDVKLTLQESFEFGKYSIEQFWELEGANILDEVYTALTEVLLEKADNYTQIIGDTEM